eukprot:CAMPEP_0198685042 /NCGR_PEP_ID=MMETSP1468-20131203/13077_1 /TAXON_ID=1461545 /ORGANISM="Mantoniella sp, Strain CCMP1436" /LENGTH=73 /DNA_ID=CAMNT_0044430283 /DNA_START=139 /DNA_END=357 /DNA_ORIENTATION=+
MPLWLNCCPSSLVLTSTTTIPAAWAGASHFTSADDTISACTGTDDPNPHSAPPAPAPAPARCSPPTFTIPTPA